MDKASLDNVLATMNSIADTDSFTALNFTNAVVDSMYKATGISYDADGVCASLKVRLKRAVFFVCLLVAQVIYTSATFKNGIGLTFFCYKLTVLILCENMAESHFLGTARRFGDNFR